MKKTITFLSVVLFVLTAMNSYAQSCCKANAGRNKSICCYGGYVTIGGVPAFSDSCMTCDSVLYNWLPATGLNNSHIANPIATPNTTPNYTLCVYLVNDSTLDTCCVACDDVIVTVGSSCCRLANGVNNNSLSNINVSLMPNPSAGNVNLEFSSPLQNGTVIIYDVAGRVVLEKKNVTGNEFKTDLTGKQHGIYMIKVFEQDALIYNDKLMIE